MVLASSDVSDTTFGTLTLFFSGAADELDDADFDDADELAGADFDEAVELDEADFDEAAALEEAEAEDELAEVWDDSETSDADIAVSFEAGALDCCGAHDISANAAKRNITATTHEITLDMDE